MVKENVKKSCQNYLMEKSISGTQERNLYGKVYCILLRILTCCKGQCPGARWMGYSLVVKDNVREPDGWDTHLL
jgi:hypothetical protein